ncbi:hypothetical protein [Paludisphaera mucosa]|uniref:Uncharacterized protein n=1 Tax=Paludisphaera mucosa TaxID=3030827 RepID=A0ABT6F900_9BACT|nr:hypothetical protein [Paludisphaera mucosa]MDG3003971.1 hypothetical protein [Paludisphaera mucosa]
MASTLARWMILAGLAVVTAPVAAQVQERPKAATEPEMSLRIEGQVVCQSIEGYEDYEERPEAEQTSDEKLLVYFRPKNYAIVRKGEDYAAHFTQDGQIRALGKKKVLLRKEKLLDYEAVSKTPPRNLYISNTFSLKGLPPGEYEYDMILRDENLEKATVTASVKFRVVAAKLPKAETDK